MVAQIERPLSHSQLNGKMPRGIVQVYTAAQRLFYVDVMASAFRTAGQGTQVLIVQFFQGGIAQGKYGSRRFVENLQWLRCDLHRQLDIANPQLDEREKQAVLELWHCSCAALESGSHSLIVLDELSLAVEWGLLSEAEVIRALSDRASSVDVILTGMHISPGLLDIADQVTHKRSVAPF